MKMPIDPAAYRRLLIASGAAILLGSLGTAVLRAWSQGSADGSDLDAAGESESATAPAENPLHRPVKCAECGMVASTREVEEAVGQPSDPASAQRRDPAGEGMTLAAADSAPDGNRATASKRYEVTVRMRDGSSRVFIDTNPANWRAGEHVMFIEGARRSRN